MNRNKANWVWRNSSKFQRFQIERQVGDQQQLENERNRRGDLRAKLPVDEQPEHRREADQAGGEDQQSLLQLGCGIRRQDTGMADTIENAVRMAHGEIAVLLVLVDGFDSKPGAPVKRGQGKRPAAIMRLFRMWGEIQSTISSKVDVAVLLMKVLSASAFFSSSVSELALRRLPFGKYPRKPFFPWETTITGISEATIVPPEVTRTVISPSEPNEKAAVPLPQPVTVFANSSFTR